MGRKCSVANCKANYESQTTKTKVYGFPLNDDGALDLWLSSLPNIIKKENLTRNMGVCSQHWPLDCAMRKVKGKEIPSVPPSIFPNCPDSFKRQTVSSSSRDIFNRNVSSSARSAQGDELKDFDLLDKIPMDFEIFHMDLLRRQFSQCKIHIIKDTSVNILNFAADYRVIEFSIEINSEFGVSAFHRNTEVPVRDLLGFQCKLERWSQLENIIIRVKNYPLCPVREITDSVKDLQKTLESCDFDSKSVDFLLEQLILTVTKPKGRRFGSTTMMISLSLFLNSRSGYRQLSLYLALPTTKTLTKNIGSFTTVGTDSEAKRVSELVFNKLDYGIMRKCIILFDEVYVKPSLRYRSGHIIGFSADNPSQPAKTVLAFMVKLLFGKKASSFVIRFIPVHHLTSNLVEKYLMDVLRIVETAGGRTVGIMSDNLSCNRALHKSLKGKYPTSDAFKIKHPLDSSRYLYLLYDPVHLFKCIRNNWITEVLQEMSFIPPGTSTTIVAKWKDIAMLYEKEKYNTVKRTTLTSATLQPSSFEKQKVSLVTNVFNEKTVAALIQEEKRETAQFVSCVLRLWKILNNRSTTSHIRLNDPDRKPITSIRDQQISFISDMSHAFKIQPANRGKLRNKTVTKETQSSLTQTLDGLADLTVTLLKDDAIKFVLLGFFQSDILEGEFGIYRQMFGGLYHITLEQILISAKFRRVHLFNLLNIGQDDLQSLPSHSNPCCTSDLTDGDWEAIDLCQEMVELISEEQRAALFYICGFITKAENLEPYDFEDSLELLQDDREFVDLVSRGKLAYPSTKLFQFSLLAYSFFNYGQETCRNHVERAFIAIYDSFSFDFDKKDHVVRRLTNTFLSGYIKKVNDLQDSTSDSKRKRQKLSHDTNV